MGDEKEYKPKFLEFMPPESLETKYGGTLVINDGE